MVKNGYIIMVNKMVNDRLIMVNDCLRIGSHNSKNKHGQSWLIIANNGLIVV